MFSLLGMQAPASGPIPYVSIQLAVRIKIIARKFSMHFQWVPVIFTVHTSRVRVVPIYRYQFSNVYR